jgi:CRP/FNR family transcriptional regulator
VSIPPGATLIQYDPAVSATLRKFAWMRKWPFKAGAGYRCDVTAGSGDWIPAGVIPDATSSPPLPGAMPRRISQDTVPTVAASAFGTIGSVAEPRAEFQRTLAKVALFSGLTDSELQFLAERAAPRHFAPGEMVFGEGEPCAGLYVVERGNIRIFKTSAGGREQVLSIDGPGSSVAEVPVFDGGAYPASGAAVDRATLLFVRKQDFQALCLAHPDVALKVLRVVGARLRRLVGIIEELSFTTVRHRLVSFLMRLAQREGTASAAGVEFLLPGSNQELAAQLGTVRELVSRNLSRLQAEGLLKLEGRHAVIPDPKALAAELDPSE